MAIPMSIGMPFLFPLSTLVREFVSPEFITLPSTEEFGPTEPCSISDESVGGATNGLAGATDGLVVMGLSESD